MRGCRHSRDYDSVLVVVHRRASSFMVWSWFIADCERSQGKCVRRDAFRIRLMKICCVDRPLAGGRGDAKRILQITSAPVFHAHADRALHMMCMKPSCNTLDIGTIDIGTDRVHACCRASMRAGSGDPNFELVLVGPPTSYTYWVKCDYSAVKL